MKRIELRPYGRGHYAIVDDDDFDFLSQWIWHYRAGYAGRPYRVGGAGTTQRLGLMHRIANRTPDGLFTDHINGNKLDNQKHNLRTVDLRLSAQNVGKGVRNTSGYCGVTWWARDSKWTCTIRYEGHQHRAGYFDTKDEAAVIRNFLLLKRING